MTRARVLVVEDDLSMCELLQETLTRQHFEVVVKTSAEEAFAAPEDLECDVVVTDLNLRGLNGLELCERIRSNRPDVPVVVITAFGSLETAIAAIRAGAYDFITKPFDIEGLLISLDRAVQYHSLKEEVKRLRQFVAKSQAFQEIIGESQPMKKVFEIITRLAESDASVLITGETGTGKELVARALHRRSRRSSGPFVAINTAALPEPLLESELFGHTKGAFTDARSERTGLLLQASGGTLFLDEIGDMPLGLQPKLLRALQDRTVRPVGGDKELPFDARIISATHRDLETAVKEGSFRDDLYFRINVIPIEVPPLRARGNDVLLLAQHFLQNVAGGTGQHVTGLSSDAAGKLLAYSWPGNIRELQNCIERAVALTAYEELRVEDLPEKIRNYQRVPLLLVGDSPDDLVPMEEVERRYVLRVLESVGWNKTLAAQILGFDRKTLYRKLEHEYFKQRAPEERPVSGAVGKR